MDSSFHVLELIEKERDSDKTELAAVSPPLMGQYLTSQNKILIMEVNSKGAGKMNRVSLKDILASIEAECYQEDRKGSHFSKVNLKDLRRLDYQINPTQISGILVRQDVVIFSFDQIRAVITATRLIFFIPTGADGILTKLENAFKHWDGTTETFETLAYDTLLSIMLKQAVNTTHGISFSCKELLSKLNQKSIISFATQDRLRNVKFELPTIELNLTSTRQYLIELLENESYLTLMNLSFAKTNPDIFSNTQAYHQLDDALSNLIESYIVEYNNLVSRIQLCNSMVQNAEQAESLRLDVVRNQLMIVNLVISVITAVIGFCGYISGIFGMNLDQTIWMQHVYGVFSGIFIATLIFMAISPFVIMYGLKHLGYVPF